MAAQQIYLMYIEFVMEILRFLTNVGFFIAIMAYYGLPLHVIRPMYVSWRSFMRSLVALLNARKVRLLSQQAIGVCVLADLRCTCACVKRSLETCIVDSPMRPPKRCAKPACASFADTKCNKPRSCRAVMCCTSGVFATGCCSRIGVRSAIDQSTTLLLHWLEMVLLLLLERYQQHQHHQYPHQAAWRHTTRPRHHRRT